VTTPAIAGFMSRVYLIMAVGLAITGVTAVVTVQNIQRLAHVATDPWAMWALFLVQIVLVVTLSAGVEKLSGAMAFALFAVYSAVTGVTLSTIFLVYSRQSIASVFWVTSITFCIVAIYGTVTKRDLTSAGNLLFMLLLGWFVAYLFSFFFAANGMFNWTVTMVGVAIFVGLTAWDANRIKKMAEAYGDNIPGAYAVNGALALYLDFINLFLLLLRAGSR
jgi:FtsH-binding integral membrane protein